jgi:hypothetical protein
MTIANHTEYSGSPKTLAVEFGSFTFSGTTVTAEVPTSLKAIIGAQFVPIAGTVGLVNTETIYLKEEPIGTADTTSLSSYYGGVAVSGTAVTVDRLVGNATGTALANDGTGITGLTVFYRFDGVDR